MDSASTLQQVVESGAFQELSPQLKVALFLGGMAFLSSALVTMTAFTRIVIVLSFVRRALATQEIPPTQVILGLSLFLTFFVMGPTFSTIETDAIKPYLEEKIDELASMDHNAELMSRIVELEEWHDDLDRNDGEELRWELDDLHHRSYAFEEALRSRTWGDEILREFLGW